MATIPQHGDVLIRVFAQSSYQLVDATTREQIAIVPALPMGLKVASERGARSGARTWTTEGVRSAAPFCSSRERPSGFNQSDSF